jgi:hypothetical protein
LFAINFCNCFLVANDKIVTNDIFKLRKLLANNDFSSNNEKGKEKRKKKKENEKEKKDKKRR